MASVACGWAGYIYLPKGIQTVQMIQGGRRFKGVCPPWTSDEYGLWLDRVCGARSKDKRVLQNKDKGPARWLSGQEPLSKLHLI